ncbi:MAG: VOC family protein [Shinella sp.]|nr:VOC family protein [Shinella sp.]
MSNIVVPEFAVTDWEASLRFYCDILGFDCLYQRSEEGFAYLEREGAELMIDQIGLGRTFGDDHLPAAPPFGRGLNLQIRVSAVEPMIAALEAAHICLYLPLEEKWYRRGTAEVGQRQFVVADPDGYLLRFYESLGNRLSG